MSVQTYLYPTNIGPLAIERLLPAVRKKIPFVAIGELELKKKATPDWQSLTMVHPSEPAVNMLFVVAPKRKDSVQHLEQQFGPAKELSLVRQAPIVIWAEHRSRSELPLQRFSAHFAIYSELIAEIAKLSAAVIDSPEHERLFTPAAFLKNSRRHHRQ
jgi:hypothetical protein